MPTMMKKKIICLLIVLTLCLSAMPVLASEESTGDEYIGVICALPSEIDLLLDEAQIDHVDHTGSMDYHVGTLCGQPVVIVQAGMGKVLASAGTAVLLNNYPVSKVIFTGIAGGVGDETEVLDVVVADQLLQHDYGTLSNDGFEWCAGYSGFDDYPKYYNCDEALVTLAYDCAVDVAGEDHVFVGTIVTGDQFVSSEEFVEKLQEDFQAIACEMEGAAVAIVCNQYDVPFVVIRTMSDKADGLAHETIENMTEIAADNSSSIVMEMLEAMGEDPMTTEQEPADDSEVSQDIQYVLYVGTNDKDTNEPVLSPEESLEKAKAILLDYFGGYTIQEAAGGWIGDDGTEYREYTMVIYLSDTTIDKVHDACDEFIRIFDQSSILIQSNPTQTEFYSGESNEATAEISYEEFKSLTDEEQIEVFSRMTGPQIYALVASSDESWPVTDYDLISPDNAKETIILVNNNGDLHFNLAWPHYGGFLPESIASMDELTGKLDVSRDGGDGGHSMSYGKNEDGSYPNDSQRSVPKTSATVRTGILDVDQYNKVAEIVTNGESEEERITALTDMGYDNEIAGRFVSDQAAWLGRDEVSGPDNIDDGAKKAGNTVDSRYGYYGITAPWIVDDLNLLGGNGQLETIFSWGTLCDSGLITDTGTAEIH